MKASLIEFVRTHRAVVFIGAGVLVLVLGLVPSCRPRKPAVKSVTPSVMGSNAVQFSIPRPVPPPVTALPKPQTNVSTNKRPVVYSVRAEVAPEPPDFPRRDVAPYGRLLQCQLINTLESLTPNTPIIGLVTEDLWQHGHRLIAAGTEVHSPAQFERTRERITSNGPWTLVFQTGEQMTVSGVALDREFDVSGNGWGITDGSAGLRGDLLRNGSLPEIKLFLATALSGVARGFQQTRSTALGDVVSATARNAGLAGSAHAIDAYAQRVLETIQREGIYVRVAAGKQFYVYVTEPIDRAKARFGGMTTSVTSTNR